jgi:hypothetical protein
MNFPSRILPNPSYKYIQCDLNSRYLIRSVPGDSGDLLDPVTGLIKQEHICSPRDQVADLSTSLLGIFEISDNQIFLTASGKGKYNEYCLPDIEVEAPIFQEDFGVDTTKRYWVILIGAIHKTPVDYTKSDLGFTAECLVEHTPMKWNYWHFSIRWLTDDEGFWHNLSDKEKKKLARRLGQEARSHIAMFAKVEEPNYSELDPSDFRK